MNNILITIFTPKKQILYTKMDVKSVESVYSMPESFDPNSWRRNVPPNIIENFEFKKGVLTIYKYNRTVETYFNMPLMIQNT